MVDLVSAAEAGVDWGVDFIYKTTSGVGHPVVYFTAPRAVLQDVFAV